MSKGSRARPLKVPKQEFDDNFEGIFGKRIPTYMKKMIPDEPVVKEESKEKPKDKE